MAFGPKRDEAALVPARQVIALLTHKCNVDVRTASSYRGKKATDGCEWFADFDSSGRLHSAMIYVCNLIEMPTHAASIEPSHLISLVPAEEQPTTPVGILARQHLRVHIHDISQPMPGCTLPGESHIAEVIDFVNAWSGQQPLLIHCVAGISRSMAAALIALAMTCDRPELAIARYLRRRAPHAQPNGRMIDVADRLLGRGGRLEAARVAIGPGSGVIAGPLVKLSVDEIDGG